MSKDDPVKTWRAPQWWPTAGIALATPFLVWFALGEPPTYAVYNFGPYDIGQQAGHIAAVLAAIVAAASVTVFVLRTRRGVADLQSWAVAAVLAMAGALGAAGWRGLTSSYSGADIGGPVVMLVGPWLIAGLLVGAAWIADTGGRAPRRRTWWLTVAAILVAPVLYAVMYALSFQDAADVISTDQYGQVRSGQAQNGGTRDLGREAHDDLPSPGAFNMNMTGGHARACAGPMTSNPASCVNPHPSQA